MVSLFTNIVFHQDMLNKITKKLETKRTPLPQPTGTGNTRLQMYVSVSPGNNITLMACFMKLYWPGLS